MRSILIAGDEPNSILADLGFAAMRVAVGLMMAFGHGLAKVPPATGFVEAVGSLGFPMPAVFAGGALEGTGAALLRRGGGIPAGWEWAVCDRLPAKGETAGRSPSVIYNQ